MNAQCEVERLLREHGATLLRSKNHQVWKLRTGQNFVIPNTPSDHRAWANALQTLSDLLSIKPEVKKSLNRKRKKGVGKPLYKADSPVVTRRRNPLDGFEFRSLEYKYDGCAPVVIERVPMTPMWCWMRRLFGYGGKV